MKISIVEIKRLETAITKLMVNRKDLQTLKVKDILHDIVCYCKKTTFKGRMKFAKKIINGEKTYIKRKNLTEEQLQARRLFELRWVQYAMIHIPGFKEKHNKRNREWAQRQRDEKTPQWEQINLNARLRRAKYKIDMVSKDPIKCKVDKCICNRDPQRTNNQKINVCQKTAYYTLYNGYCIPNDHPFIDKIKGKSPD